MRLPTVFVLWSGGIESTYLIERLLADERYFAVVGGYVRLLNNPEKTEAELDAIDRLVPILRGRTDKFVYQGVIMELRLARPNPNLALKQPALWLLAAAAAIPRVDEVAIGYVKDDQAAEHLSDLERLHEGFRPFMHGPPPRLVFPLRDLTKAEVLAALSPELQRHCVTCEHPVLRDGVYHPCGRCGVCKRRARAGG